LNITFSNSFKRSFKKKIKNNSELEKLFWEKVDLFSKNPFDNNLKTHKLTGNLKDLWSFRINFNIRILFYFHDSENAVLTDMGSHDEVY